MGCNPPKSQAGTWGARFGGREEGMGYPFTHPGEKRNDCSPSELGGFAPRVRWGLSL